MKAIQAILVALVAAIILTSVAAAGPDAAKQRVVINMKILPAEDVCPHCRSRPAPWSADKGTISSNWTNIPGRDVMRDGQKVTIYNGAVTTFTGKRGTLTIRDRNEWVDVGRRERRREIAHQHLEGRARDRPVRRARREGAGWPCGPRKPVVRTLRGLPDPSVRALNQTERCARACRSGLGA